MKRRMMLFGVPAIVGLASATMIAQPPTDSISTTNVYRYATEPGVATSQLVEVRDQQGQTITQNVYGYPGAGWIQPGTAVVEERRRRSEEDAARMKEFQSAVNELRKAKEADEKSEARAKVSELISSQLDRDLKTREEQLVEIEKRAQQLREQLEQRRSAKGEMLKMLMLLVENPQAGLGIPPEWMQMMTPPVAPRYPFGAVPPSNLPGQGQLPSTALPPSVSGIAKPSTAPAKATRSLSTGARNTGLLPSDQSPLTAPAAPALPEVPPEPNATPRAVEVPRE